MSPSVAKSAYTYERIRALHAEGLSNYAISERLGLSARSVKERLHKLGLRGRGRQTDDIATTDVR